MPVAGLPQTAGRQSPAERCRTLRVQLAEESVSLLLSDVEAPTPAGIENTAKQVSFEQQGTIIGQS